MRHVAELSPDPAPATQLKSDSTSSCKPNRCERYFWLGALLLGLLQAWGRRHESVDGLAYMGSDGISYLDIGEAYWRGDFYSAVNAMWSPFYSWLLGLTLKVIKPPPFWEFTVVRLMNFLIYVFVLFAFSYFLRALRRDHRERLQGRALPESVWLVFGYTIFIWTSLLMNRVSRTSPDLLVAGLIFLASGLLLRIRNEESRWRSFVILGMVLGIGYLTKTILFPLGLLFIAVAFFVSRRGSQRKTVLLHTFVCLLVFLTLTTPFIIVLSRAKHRITIGESGRLNYAWYVNGAKRYIHWQGEPAGSGTPAHPTRRVFRSPDVYEFGGPPGVSYPPWYDPSYWYEGVTPHFNLRQQLAAIYRNLGALYSFMFYRFFLVALGMALFLLLYQSGQWRSVLRNVGTYWFLLAPSLIAVGLYLLINVEPRYLAPFVPVITLSLLAAAQSSQTPDRQRLMAGIVFAIIIAFIVSITPLTVRSAVSTVKDLVPGRAAARDKQWQVAEGLRQIGLQPNERVAVIGKPMFDAWPRLARVRVVAELPDTPGNAERFWSADASTQQKIMSAFVRAGARVVVADAIPNWARQNPAGGDLSCWKRVGLTEHYYYCFLQ